MKKLNKVLSVLLAVLMMFSAISIAAVAAGTYTVKYNPNGGSGSMANTTFTVDEAKALRTNAFKKTGYTFLGWGESRTATEVLYTDGQVVTNIAEEGETKTLYALWKANTYTIEFNANGGEGEMAPQVHTYNQSQALPANTFTREGYTFLGWSKSKVASSPTFVDQASVKNQATAEGFVVVFYAVWQKNPVTVRGIFVKTEPTKTEYFTGEVFDATGLTIGANLSDNTVKTLTTGFEVSAPDMTTAGEKTVTVTYEGATTTFTINVVEAPAEPEYNYTFSIVAPENTTVAHGESVVLSAKLEGTYPEGVYVRCTANNNNFVATLNADGSYTVTAEGVGTTVFTATLYAADGTVLAEDTVELTALTAEEPSEPSDPEEPSEGNGIMGVLAGIVNFFKGIFAKIIAFVKGIFA